MLNRAIIPYHLRFYSSPRKALKLWVKLSGCPSTQVPVKGCKDIDDFAEKVKRKLNIKDRVALFTSLDKEPIKPWLSITELLKTDLKCNTDESPLFAKILPATQDSIARKTIYIGDTDYDGEFTGKYMQYTIRNDHDLQRLVNNSHGLVTLSSPDHVLTHFDDIKDGEIYYHFKFDQKFRYWLNLRQEAIEAEKMLAIKIKLEEKLGTSLFDLPTHVYDSKGKKFETWDGVMSSKDALYLLESKHSMSIEKIKEIAKRVKNFPQILEQSSEKKFKKKYSKIVGVACGTHFTDESREEARRLSLVVVYPSDGRYLVESD